MNFLTGREGQRFLLEILKETVEKFKKKLKIYGGSLEKSEIISDERSGWILKWIYGAVPEERRGRTSGENSGKISRRNAVKFPRGIPEEISRNNI